MILKVDIIVKIEEHVIKNEIHEAFNKYKRLNKEDKFWLNKRSPWNYDLYNKFEEEQL